MSLQNFIDKIGPVVSAAWLNVVDSIKYTIFEDAHTKADARTALTADAPMEVENGGTGVRTLADFMTTLNMGAGFGAELSNTPAPGPPLSGTGVLNIGLVASHTQLVNLSGVTITSFGTSADVAYPIYILRFFGAHTLVHSSSLVLPGAANITTAAGDYAIVQYIGAATGWRVAFYQRASAGSTYVEGDSIGFSPGHDFYLEKDMPKVFSKIGRTEESIQAERFIKYIQDHGEVPFVQAYKFIHTYFPNSRDFEGIVAGAIRAGYVTMDMVSMKIKAVKP